MASSKSTTPQSKESITQKPNINPQFREAISPFFETFRKEMRAGHRKLRHDLSQIASSLREDGRADDRHAAIANFAAEFIERDIEDDALSTERSIADVKRALSL